MTSIDLEVRAGTQTNCAGFVLIRVRFEIVAVTKETQFINHASNVPDEYVQAIWRGAEKALNDEHSLGSVRMILLDALVHPIDANQRKFEEAGYKAVKEGLEELFKKKFS